MESNTGDNEIIERIMTNRSEHWRLESGTWHVYILDELRNHGKEIHVFNAHGFGDRYIDIEKIPIGEIWNKQHREGSTEEFRNVFRSWRAWRRIYEDKKFKEQEQAEREFEELFREISSFTVRDKHRIHVQMTGEQYLGIRTPENNERTRRQRKARCWNCSRYLDNYQHPECRACGWILCGCGACGCGQVQSTYNCPRCDIKFRKLDCRGSYPFCSPKCRYLALADYSEYLKSAEWQQRRLLRLEKDNYECCDCGVAATDVHHLTYERIGKENLSDLVSLCARCHAIRHGDSPQGFGLLHRFRTGGK